MPADAQTLAPRDRYAAAMDQIKAGRPAAALALLGPMHDANPNIPEVEFQIARILMQADQFGRALPHAANAARLSPAEPAVWTTYADICALEGTASARADFLNALRQSNLAAPLRQTLSDRFGANAARSRPATAGAPAADLKTLLAQAQSGRHSEAQIQAGAILSKYPTCALAANIRGVALLELGRENDALQSFAAAFKADPNYSEARANAAPIIARHGHVAEAMAQLRHAIACTPDLLSALATLGHLTLAQGQPKAALHWLHRAASVAPEREDIRRALGNAYTRLRDYSAAREAFAAAVRLTARRNGNVLAMLAQAESHLGNDSEALSLYDEALKADPKNAGILGAKAVFLQGLGKFAEAETALLAAIKNKPTEAEAYRLYYSSHKAQVGEELIAQMQQQFANPATSDRDRMGFGFALAKALEDTKDYARVFDYLDPANALMRKENPYSFSDRQTQITRLKEAFSQMDWHQAPLAGASDAAPIFVTGMPRSGTTLVEQIIASHSLVSGGGELGDSAVSALRLLNPSRNGDMRAASSIPAQDFLRLGADYAAMMEEKFPGSTRITDKSIQTYLTIGLMKLALPNARFIVVRRDPRDTLLSIYKNLFPAGTHLYAYDQVDLAKQYTTFVEMVDFWRDQTPGWFHEVQYEDLVANPEAQSRALIAACGLDWEEACLNFHQNDRKVETLSVYQVRQPISKGSVRAWERYSDRLQPMLDQLRADGHISE